MYQQIVFIQGDEAIEPLSILEEHGQSALFDYCLQWDMGDGGDESNDAPWGKDDDLFQFEDYFLSYNTRIGYVGLCKKV
jgi:hypothetical protein